MSGDSIEKVIRDLYGARAAGDYDKMAELCDPEASLYIAGSSELCPIAGTIKGKAALRQAFEQLAATFAFAKQEMQAILIDGDRAAVHWRVNLTCKPTSKSASTEFCDLWTVRDGKMVSAMQFIDTALAAEMMR